MSRAAGNLEPARDTVRICVAHGMVDSLSPDPDDPATISLGFVESAIAQNKIHYLALGERHSLTEVGGSGRVWYAGTPEPTDYNEIQPGFALVAAIDGDAITTKEVKVGRWSFIERKQVDLNTSEDIGNLRDWLENLQDKERTVLKLRFIGTLTLSLNGALERLLIHARDILGAVETRTGDLVVIPDDADFIDFGFSGFAKSTVEQLRSKAGGSGPDAIVSRDALTLLVRLAGGDL